MSQFGASLTAKGYSSHQTAFNRPMVLAAKPGWPRKRKVPLRAGLRFGARSNSETELSL